MKSIATSKAKGFTVVESLIVLVVVVVIVAAGAYVIHRHKKSNTVAATTTAKTAQAGTTQSIDQLTQQDEQSEQSIDTAADGQTQAQLTNVNSANGNVGGAYNAANL